MLLNNSFIRCLVAVLFMISLLCAGPIAGSTPDVYAASAPGTEIFIEDTGAEMMELGEQTEWVYRIVDNKLQKRLWSITYGVWLTEWMWA